MASFKIAVLLLIKSWTFLCIDCFPTSSYTKVISFKQSLVLPVYVNETHQVSCIKYETRAFRVHVVLPTAGLEYHTFDHSCFLNCFQEFNAGINICHLFVICYGTNCIARVLVV